MPGNTELNTLSTGIRNSNAITTKSYLDLLRSRDGELLKSLDNKLPRRKSGKSQSLVRGLSLHAYIIQVATTPFGNTTLAHSTLLLFLITFYSIHWLRHRSGLAGSLPVSSILFSFLLCRPIHTWSTRPVIQQACHVTNRKLCINKRYDQIFNFLILG